METTEHCGPLRAVGNDELYRFLDHGISMQQLHSNQVANWGTQRHASLVVDMPNGKSYLIDPTIGQFFHDNPSEVNARLAPPGDFFRTHSSETAQIGKELLQHGYIELTPRVAQLYIEAFGGGKRSPNDAFEELRPQRKVNYARMIFDSLMPPLQEPLLKSRS